MKKIIVALMATGLSLFANMANAANLTYKSSASKAKAGENVVFGSQATNTKTPDNWTSSEPIDPEPVVSTGTGTVKYPKAIASTGLVKAPSVATWKAKADMNCVFTGWKWVGGGEAPAAFASLSENEQKNATLKLEVLNGEQVRPTDFEATWAMIAEDAISLNGKELTADGLEVSTLSCVTAKISGLPNGLKFDKKTLSINGTPRKPGTKTVKVSITNASGYTATQEYTITVAEDLSYEVKHVPYSNIVSGEAVQVFSNDSASGKVKGGKVYATGKKASVSAIAANGYVFMGWYADAALTERADWLPKGFLCPSQSFKVSEDLPIGVHSLYARFAKLQPWTVGTFDGACYGEKSEVLGTVTFTVTSKGKVYGRVETDGESYSFNASTFDDIRESEGGTCFVAHPALKVGGETKTFELVIGESEIDGLGYAEFFGADNASVFAAAVQNGWKLKPSSLPACPSGKAAIDIDERDPETGLGLRFKFGVKGQVRVTGKLLGDNGKPVSVSYSTQLMPIGWRSTMTPNLLARFCVYVAPKRNLAAGICLAYDVLLSVGENGKFATANVNLH